jgi:hypothetical protein
VGCIRHRGILKKETMYAAEMGISLLEVKVYSFRFGKKMIF